MRDLLYDKKKEKNCAIVAEFPEVIEYVLDFRPTLYNPSLHSVASKVYPLPSEALAHQYDRRNPKQTGISMVTRNYQG